MQHHGYELVVEGAPMNMEVMVRLPVRAYAQVLGLIPSKEYAGGI